MLVFLFYFQFPDFAFTQTISVPGKLLFDIIATMSSIDFLHNKILSWQILLTRPLINYKNNPQETLLVSLMTKSIPADCCLFI